jgi:ankyrin repeat protein
LRAKNVNVNLANKNGETALMRAVRLGNAEPVRLFWRALTPTLRTRLVYAYILALQKGYTEIEKVLTTAAAPQNTPGSLNASSWQP